MGHKSQFLADKPIVELDEIDSTNNYAMRLIDADTAQDGLTITAQRQTSGKGQRGRQWQGSENESLLMSIIIIPSLKIDDQFILCAAAAVSVIQALEFFEIDENIKIKWTNDIIINDKKAGGILIENVLRGDAWNYAVIGIGLNVSQSEFSMEFPYATSIKIASGKKIDVGLLRDEIRYHFFRNTSDEVNPEELINSYNEYLFKKNEWQEFSGETGNWQAQVLEAGKNGKLKVRTVNGDEVEYMHGAINWQWR